jgi:hypothetical protein
MVSTTTDLNVTNFANTVSWLYGKGHAERIAFFKRGELVEYTNPTEIRFFDGIVRVFCDSTLDELHLTWLVWSDDSHKWEKRDVVFHRNGSASIAA